MEDLKYKKGELIALSTGEYSDYYVNCFVRVLKDFDASELLDLWAKDNAVIANVNPVFRDTSKTYRKKEGCMDFIVWLNKFGYAEYIKYRELHVGSHDETELLSGKRFAED